MKQIEIHIPNDLGFEKLAMASAAELAAMLGFSEDRIEDLKTALGEACINAIEHGSKKRKTEKLLVTLTADDEHLQVDVHDHGPEFEPTDEKPDIRTKLSGASPPRGWGMFLIRSLVDSFEISSTPEGNIARLVIYLHRK